MSIWRANSSPASVTRVDILLVGALIAGFSLAYSIYALRVGSFQNDEQHYMQIARYIPAHFPSALFSIPGYGYIDGIGQRLDIYVLSIPFSFLSGPGAFELGHVIQCVLFASTSLPVFLFARRAGLGRVAALLAAALCVIVPWGVDATSFLAEPAAYPAYAWVLNTTWLATTSPSLRHDGAAIVALLVAALARTELLGMALILPLAIIWQEWSVGLADVPRLRRARALIPRLWARHRTLTAIVAIALLVGIVNTLGLLPGGGLGALTGHYGLPSDVPLSYIFVGYRYVLARVAVGTGFLAMALAIPWTLSQLARPRDGRQQATAAVCLLGGAVILLAVISNAPASDERYGMYLTVPIVLSAVWALSDWARTPRLSMTAAAALLTTTLAVVALVASVAWPPMLSDYDWFTYPAAIFYQRVLLTHADLLQLPIVSASTVVYALVAVGTLLFLAVSSRARGMRPAAVLMATALVVVCATETLYTLTKYTESPAGGGAAASLRSFVDEAVPSGTNVGAFGVGLGSTSEYLAIWNAVEFWNTTVDRGVYLQSLGYLPFPLGGDALSIELQNPSGRLVSLSPGLPVPRYMLVPALGTNNVGLNGKLVVASPWVALDLLHLSSPPRVDWTEYGAGPNGNLTSGVPSYVTDYSGALAGQGQRCQRLSLITPFSFSGRWPFRIGGGSGSAVTGLLRPNTDTTITLPLRVLATGENVGEQVSVLVRGAVPASGSAVLAFIGIGACTGRASVTTSVWPLPPS